MSGREILTLQFGHYSNFVGAHLWNLQEFGFAYDSDKPSEINHDVFYREGLSLKNQVTFTPRTLLVDLKGSLKGLPEQGGLYEEIQDPEKIKSNVAWNEEAIEIRKDEKCENNVDAIIESAQNITLDPNNVRVWSDFLYTRFHPRTINILREYEHENKEKVFDVFAVGYETWKSEQFQEDYVEKIRQYLEECDNFQGFQVFADAYDAFSGLSTACLEYLKDEYERKSIFTLPLIPGYYSDYSFDDDHKMVTNDSLRVLNVALCFSALTENSSLFVPLSVGSTGWRQPGPKRNFNHVIYDYKSTFHTSAILATAVDTFSLPYRLKANSFSLNDLCYDLTPCNRKMAAASVCLPFSINEQDFFLDCLDAWDGPLTRTITPNCNIGSDRVMQLMILRGVPEARLKKSLKQAGSQKDVPAYKYDNVKDMLRYYLSCTTYASANHVTAIEKGAAISQFYPNIFDSRVGRDGNIVHERSPEIGVKNLPVMAGLHTSSEIGETIKSLYVEATKIKYKRLHRYRASGMESDDFKEALEMLLELKERYEDEALL